MEALLPYIVQYGIPIVFGLLAAWKTYAAKQARKDADVKTDALDILTTVVEILDDKGVKLNVETLSEGTPAAKAIDDSIDRLDLDKIRAFIRANKK